MFLILSSYASAVEISSNVGLSSDYIWRGMTQTNGDIAVNGGFDLSTDNGFYFGIGHLMPVLVQHLWN